MAAMEGEEPSAAMQDSVMARVGRLTTEAQEVLRLLSVIPVQISLLEVRLLTGGVGDFVAFRHELTRRAVEASLTRSERVAANRLILEILPSSTDPARLVHHAREANDVERLVQVAPVAAQAALAVGSQGQAVEHFRQLAPHLDMVDPELKGPILDEWALTEIWAGDWREVVGLNALAIAHYRQRGDHRRESASLADGALYQEQLASRDGAERFLEEAAEALGPDPDHQDLARVLETRAYLALRAGDAATTLDMVEKTMETAGPDIDERLLVRCLVHKGIALHIIHYPDGTAILDEAIELGERLGVWSQAARALTNQAWSAVDNYDLPTALSYNQRGFRRRVAGQTCNGERPQSHPCPNP